MKITGESLKTGETPFHITRRFPGHSMCVMSCRDYKDPSHRAEAPRNKVRSDGQFAYLQYMTQLQVPTAGVGSPALADSYRCSHPTNNVVHPLTCWTEGTSTTRGSRQEWVIGP